MPPSTTCPRFSPTSRTAATGSRPRFCPGEGNEKGGARAPPAHERSRSSGDLALLPSRLLAPLAHGLLRRLLRLLRPLGLLARGLLRLLRLLGLLGRLPAGARLLL